jgi:hypothetical protein
MSIHSRNIYDGRLSASYDSLFYCFVSLDQQVNQQPVKIHKYQERIFKIRKIQWRFFKFLLF